MLPECWEVELRNDGSWHCYSRYYYRETAARRLRVGNRPECLSTWVIDVDSRSRALTIAKRDWKSRREVNIIPALPYYSIVLDKIEQMESALKSSQLSEGTGEKRDESLRLFGNVEQIESRRIYHVPLPKEG